MKDHLSWKTTHFRQKNLHFNVTEPVTRNFLSWDHILCQWGGFSSKYSTLLFKQSSKKSVNTTHPALQAQPTLPWKFWLITADWWWQAPMQIKYICLKKMCSFKTMVQWSLYFKTLYFKTTLIIRPFTMVWKCIFVYNRIFTLKACAMYMSLQILMVSWVIFWFLRSNKLL